MMIDMPVNQYRLDMPPTTQVANNFQFYELTKSDIAERLGIDNSIPTLAILRNAIRTCRRILQPARDHYGPITPNSLYRRQALERAIKSDPRNPLPANWISSSQHTTGEAVDFEVIGIPNLELARWVRDHLDFDQLILECHNPEKGPNSGWVHVSYRSSGNNRREVKSYIPDVRTGKFDYFAGLLTESVA